MSRSNVVQPFPLADGRAGTRHVFVRDLVLPADIGVHHHEHGRQQQVRINLDLSVHEGNASADDDLANVVCYERIADRVRLIVAEGHVRLVETLAERIADMCLADHRVAIARVRIEKLEALSDAESVGVEIERFNGGA
ncbi:MAG: dihydroneopterin aldolase [Alphaproteobacteria bacterium]|nr:dihydroneopterin aldolase [Alphaproteobacteria bacterium]